MRINRLLISFVVVLSFGALLAGQDQKPVSKKSQRASAAAIKHVVLLGIDGFHALDLENFVASLAKESEKTDSPHGSRTFRHSFCVCIMMT